MSKFREMRRKRQQLSNEESVAILEKATAGTLALLGDDDYPYAVPISYVYHEGKLYFHSALAGHKVDAIRKCISKGDSNNGDTKKSILPINIRSFRQPALPRGGLGVSYAESERNYRYIRASCSCGIHHPFCRAS